MILKDLGLMPFPHYLILLLLNSLGEEKITSNLEKPLLQRKYKSIKLMIQGEL